MNFKRIVSALSLILLTACNPGLQLIDCTKGVEDVEEVLARGAAVDPVVEEISRRLDLICVSHEEIATEKYCWRDVDGCTVQLGTPPGEWNPKWRAIVPVANDRSTARVTAHEIQHWIQWNEPTRGCPGHTDDCWDWELEAELKLDIR